MDPENARMDGTARLPVFFPRYPLVEVYLS